jgi:hypothetical protein
MGAKSLCANCFYIRTLSMEDVFLLNDSAFWYGFNYLIYVCYFISLKDSAIFICRFDAVNDGRRIADEHMLTYIESLNLKDCINITDRAILGELFLFLLIFYYSQNK